MSSTGKTPHYNLSQFSDADKPTWRGDYNGDMNRIDTSLNDTHVQAVQAVGIANAAKSEAAEAAQAAATATDALEATQTAANTANTTANSAKSEAEAAKTEASSAKTEAAAAKTEASAAKAKVDTIGRHNIVIIGDSWTLVESYALVAGFKAIPAVEGVWSIGQGGATIQTLQQQLEFWAADTTIDHDAITDVVIVAGINNVYRNLQDITDSEAYDMGVKITEAFGNNVAYHYFPNNSRTSNAGRNARYMTIIQAFMRAGITAYPETLYLTGYNNGEMYRDNDQWGTYHLSADGYKRFAKILWNLMQGSHCDGMIGSKNVTVSAGEGSDIIFDPQLCFIYYDNNSATLKGGIQNCAWREGITDEEKKNPAIIMKFKDEEIGYDNMPFRFPGSTVASIVAQSGIMAGTLSGTTFSTRGNARAENWSVPYIDFNFTINGRLII